MSGNKVINEVENVIIFCIAIFVLSFFFYYLIDFKLAKVENFVVNLELLIIKFLAFTIGGFIAAVVQYIRLKTWDFRLFFWVNVGATIIFVILNINWKLFL